MPTNAPNPHAQTPRTRLLIVNSTLHIGGAEQIAAWLAEHVSRTSFETFACYLKEPGLIADQMKRQGVDLVPVPGLMPGRRDYFSFLNLRRLIRQRGIQIIHTHDIHGMIEGAACRILVRGLRWVHTFHFGNYPHRTLRHKIFEGTLCRIADALVAVSHSQSLAIRKLYWLPANRLRVIWNGVQAAEPDGRDPDLGLGNIPDLPIIASISTMIPQKGIEYLLESAALLQRSGEHFVLLVAGDGRLRSGLIARSQELGLQDCVRFLGWVPQASSRVLPACDIFVQSSLWEAMSVVVLEAMAAAKPVVATSVGENPRVVLNGETGVLVPPGDPAALAEGLRAVLRDATLRQRMGQAARRRYQEQFTLPHMVAQYERLYAELAGTAA